MAQDPKSFKWSADASDSLANSGQVIEFYQVPSKRFVKFKSFLTQYEDAYTSKWQRTPVFGKMDPIHTFQHTQRTINLGWDILAGSVEEAVENQLKLSLLIKMLYPSYAGSDNKKRIQTAPIFKVKFMNLITDATVAGGSSNAEVGGLVCTIDGFTHSPVTESGFFTFKRSLFAKNIQMRCTMHVLHTHDLGWGGEEDADSQNKFFEEAYPYRVEDSTSDRLIETVDKEGGVATYVQRDDDVFTAGRGGGVDTRSSLLKSVSERDN
jgi:hypothetical protein